MASQRGNDVNDVAMQDTRQGVADEADAKLGPDAYKKLYPAEYYKQFIDNAIRPDGRSFGSGRPVTIGLNAIEGPSSSALIKIGSTTVLAGCTFTIVPPDGASFEKGELEVTVSMSALSLGGTDRRKANELSQSLTLLVQRALDSSEAVDLTRLISKSKKAALKANVGVHVLDADGAVLDACLLAAGSALASLKTLPPISEMGSANDGVAIAKEDIQDFEAAQGVSTLSNFVDLQKLPLYHTIGLYNSHLMVDPSGEEEELMNGCASIAIDSQGNLSGVDASKPAFTDGLSTMQLIEVVEAAKLRHKDVLQLMQDAL